MKIKYQLKAPFLGLPAILFCLVSFSARLSAATDQGGNPFDVIVKVQDTPTNTVWRIYQPNVKIQCSSYPTIAFAAGDILNFDAGGAVQTGGSGATWKLYVNPQGPNSDRLYHGEIQIPNVINQLTRFSNLKMNQNYTLTSGSYLMLGYQDDNYSDNGYYAHDDGTGNQARNVGSAWVIVSVGHHGTVPPPASQFAFAGINPTNFRYQAGWHFYNFDTADLSWDTFSDAFDLHWWDYANPLTYVAFAAGRGLASSGNCFGMCFLADVGEDQFVVGILQENFWNNYSSNGLPGVTSGINTSHWKQISGHFIHGWISGLATSPADTAAAIERDLAKADYNYGLLSLSHGTGGHVLIPLGVTHSGAQTLIRVYDPNRPSQNSPDSQTYPAVTITGGNWSYDMGGNDGTWSGPGGQLGSGLAYVPYLNGNGWSDLPSTLSGVLEVIFGADVSVDQVTDGSGRRLYVSPSSGEVDKTSAGLGTHLFRLPHFTYADQPIRPRSPGQPVVVNQTTRLTPFETQHLAQLQNEYGADYGGSGQVFLIDGTSFKNLNFAVTGTNPARAVRMMVGQNGQFIEIKSTPQAAGQTHPNLMIRDSASLAAGITVADKNAAALNVTFTHGALSTAANTMTVEQTDAIAVTTSPIGIRVAANNLLAVQAPGVTRPINVSTQVFNSQEIQQNAPARQVTPEAAVR